MSSPHEVTRVFEAALCEALQYDPNTGIVSWRGGRRGVRPGEIAGTVGDQGYIIVRFMGRRLRAHRLAWRLHYGEWPVDRLDHRNGLQHDNRIANLRMATAAENKQNESKPRADNISGRRGVSPIHGGKFRAGIRAHGKSHHLGVFATPEEAHAAYLLAKRELHPFAEIA